METVYFDFFHHILFLLLGLYTCILLLFLGIPNFVTTTTTF
jgi:hypothetical protein